eukprot:7102205-Lingulodinium_polyedra.AAC.1
MRLHTRSGLPPTSSSFPSKRHPKGVARGRAASMSWRSKPAERKTLSTRPSDSSTSSALSDTSVMLSQ